MQTTLNQSKDFNRIVSVRHCENIDSYELVIQSQWLGAKNPDGIQTEFKGLFTKDEMLRVVDTFQQSL